MAKPTAPSGLSAKARRYWRSIADRYELDAHEGRILEDICREIDVIEQLQATFDADPRITARGSMGQEVINPVLDELRKRRTALATLMKSLKLPDGEAAGSASAQASAAATARWQRAV